MSTSAVDIAAGELETPTPHAVLQEVLELSRRVSIDMQADEVVHWYVDALARLFPGRLFAARLFSLDNGELEMAYATGRMKPELRMRLFVTDETIETHDLDVAELLPRLERCDQYVPLFDNGASGFEIPLMDERALAGLLSVEYAPGTCPPPDDRPVITQVALQLGSALRNIRLHRESVYLQEYLSKLFDHANAPIMVMGNHGEVRFTNRAFLALTGFRRDDLVGEEWVSLFPEPERQRLLPIYIDALRGEATSNVEIKLPRRDGTLAHVAVNTASILGADSEVESVIYIFRDITEVRELEEQIIHAEKLATLGQLAAGVVHELNNPLTSISAYGSYLLRKQEQNEAEPADVERLRRIVAASERILKFTRDLVAYARPSSEQPGPVSITEVLDQAVVFCEHLIDECGVAVDKHYHVALPPVYGVKGQLVQVFVNLITNACHAMPLDAGQLRLEAHADSEGSLCVRVIDNGKGIPEDNLARVFEPFFSTKGEGKGTGLGLSIVRNIVEQHRGRIVVTSEIGAGTQFEVALACRPQPATMK